MLEPYSDKTITAVCTFAYSAGPGHEPILFQGRTEGKMVPARGPANFGMFGDDGPMAGVSGVCMER